jgi:hypothetical protein
VAGSVECFGALWPKIAARERNANTPVSTGNVSRARVARKNRFTLSRASDQVCTVA